MKISTRDMILISMFAGLTAIGAFIKIPTPVVPFTLQFLFCAYSGILLGAKYGLYSQLLYVAIGLLGFPIFTQGGGITYILQPTFGYLIGFITASFVIGKLMEKIKTISFIKMFSSVLCGLFFVYLFGVTYLYMIFNLYMNKNISIYNAIGIAFTPYIISDMMLSFLITVSAMAIIPAMKKSGFLKTA